MFREWPPFEPLVKAVHALAFLFNCYVAVLILTISPDSIRHYKYFLLLLTGFDNLLIIVMTFLFMPDQIGTSTGYSFNGWLAFLGPDAGNYLNIICYIVGVNIIVTVTYCMFYRLFALLSNTAWMEYFVSYKGTLTAICVYSFIDLVLFYVMNEGKSSQEEYLEYDAGRSAIVIAQLTAQGISIWLLTRTRLLSAQTKKLHRQFLRALVIQAAYPLCLFALPTLTAIIFNAFRLSNDQVRLISLQVGVISLTFFPAMNSLSTILCVAKYRRFTANLLKKIVPIFRIPLRGTSTEPTHVTVPPIIEEPLERSSRNLVGNAQSF